MSGNLKITNKMYGSITGQAKTIYDAMMKAKPKGTKVSPSPVQLGHRILNNTLQMKIGAHKFDQTENKHLYLEAIYEEVLTPEDLKLLSNHSTEPAVALLVAFSERGWDAMTSAYTSETSGTVFQNVGFAPFDVWGANQSIRNLKKL